MKNIRNWKHFLTFYKEKFNHDFPSIISDNINSILSDLDNGNIDLKTIINSEEILFKINFKTDIEGTLAIDYIYNVKINIENQNNYKNNTELNFIIYPQDCKLRHFDFYENFKNLKKEMKENPKGLIKKDEDINFGF